MSRKVHAGFGRGVSEKGREVPRRHPTSAACHPGAIERRWTRGRVIDAMCEWRSRYGRLPTSYDWSRTHARRRGREALEPLGAGEWPTASVVGRLFGSWAVARRAASGEHVDAPQIAAPEPVELIGHTRDLCAQSPLIAAKSAITRES